MSFRDLRRMDTGEMRWNFPVLWRWDGTGLLLLKTSEEQSNETRYNHYFKPDLQDVMGGGRLGRDEMNCKMSSHSGHRVEQD